MAISDSVKQITQIRCIFFGDFHDVTGPRITVQIPDDYISRDTFTNLQNYIICKPQLREKIITINTAGHKIIGYPVHIKNERFPRNEYIFNLCFVCEEGARTAQYEPVVKKLANYLITLEMESGFASNEANRSTLKNILQQILHDLNKIGHCVIPIDEANTIHLRVVEIHDDPVDVHDHQVPVFTVPRSSFNPVHWDLTTQQILQFIDGYNHVAKIAAETDVEISLVKACIQNMVYYGVVKVIPIFQYSNVYTVTPSIRQLAYNKNLQEECRKYVAINERHLPANRDIFKLYCALAPGSTVKDVCSRHNPHSLKIDEQKLIQFGMMKGLIRRLHKFPILIGEDQGVQKQFKAYFDGLHSYDEICCKTGDYFEVIEIQFGNSSFVLFLQGMNHQELDEKVEKEPGNILLCWK
uniref:Nitrogen permease regulator 2-like protein n=1 Tax=Strigamia maritima TaxID=126957 RepID=T1IUN9_STRMM